MGTIEEGGRSPEYPVKSKEVQQHREKIICNRRWLSGTSDVTTVGVQRGFKLPVLHLPPFVTPRCSVWSEPFLEARGFCRTHSP